MPHTQRTDPSAVAAAPNARPTPPAMLRDRLARSGLPLVRHEARRAWLRSGQRADLDELVSVGHAVLARAVDRFQPAKARFAAYLIQRLRWAMVDTLRLRARRSRLAEAPTARHDQANAGDVAPPFESSHGAFPCVASSARTPEQVVFQRRRSRRLRRALGQLPELERALLVGHYFEGRRFDELAAQLGISRTMACRRHRGAMQRVARLMGATRRTAQSETPADPI